MPPIRGRVGLNDVDRLVLDQCDVLTDAGKHLAGRDRRVQRGRQLRVTLCVVGVERLFDPDQVELLQRPADSHGRWSVPLLVGIDHERDIGAEVLPDGGNPVEVDPVVRLPDLDLDAADALGERLAGPLLHMFQWQVQEPT